MQLKVNGKDIDVTLENEKTVGDVLKSFENEAAKNNATTLKITLNGKNIEADKFDTILDMPLEDNTSLELTVISQDEVITALKEIAGKLDTEKLSDIPILLQSGHDKEASEIIGSFATECNNFFHTATLASLFPDLYDKIVIDGNTISDFIKYFVPILSDFENAMKEKDTVTIGDLAEYEISPRLKNICEALSNLA